MTQLHGLSFRPFDKSHPYLFEEHAENNLKVFKDQNHESVIKTMDHLFAGGNVDT